MGIVHRPSAYLRSSLEEYYDICFEAGLSYDSSGRNSVWFARHGIDRVLGVDVSEEMIEEARVLADRAGLADRCEFQHLDFLSMPVGPRFDMVAALGVFDYVENAEEFLRHMSAFADRVVYGSFPGWTLIRSPLRKIRYSLRGCPTRFYRRGELVGLFEAVGFGPVELKPVPSGCLAWSVKNHHNEERQ